METKEFEQLMSEAPARADETKITIETETQPKAGEDNPTSDTETGNEKPQTVTMSVGQFGTTVAGIYTAVSDFVYKKVKKADPPAWGENEKEAITAAVVPVLEQYNLQVSPLTNLIVTLAVVEAMRYAKKPVTGEEEANE